MNQHYSPLRYPGGKGRLLKFIQDIIVFNNLDGGTYIEPYAGGAGVAIGLLVEDYVSQIVINDIDRSVYSIWSSILHRPDEFMQLVWDTPITLEQWQKQKHIQRNKEDFDLLELGFSTFFLNRANRSGVLNAGVIGGKEQAGSYRIDARFNKKDLIRRINLIANHADSIEASNKDALDLLNDRRFRSSKRTLAFIDPPYYKKGSDLYANYYKHNDHVNVANAIKVGPVRNWVVTYDNADEINQIYGFARKIIYDLRYSVSHTSKSGSEVMFYSNHIELPHKKVVGKC